MDTLLQKTQTQGCRRLSGTQQTRGPYYSASRLLGPRPETLLLQGHLAILSDTWRLRALYIG